MQKKILPLCFALLGFLPLTAQVKKGTVIAGAGVNISSSTTAYIGSTKEPAWQRRTQLQLEAGKAIKNNLVLGVRVGTGNVPANDYYMNNGQYMYTYRNSHFYTAELFLKKYVPMGKKFMFFSEAGLTGFTNRYKSATPYIADPYYSDLKIRQVSLTGSMGISYNLSKRVALDVSFNNLLAFRYSTAKGTETALSTGEVTPVNSHVLSINPFNGANRSVSVGIKIRLGKQ